MNLGVALSASLFSASLFLACFGGAWLALDGNAMIPRVSLLALLARCHP